jgi:hypothetical protein
MPEDDWGPDEIAGDEIEFRWDHGVAVPLWDEEGLLPEEPEWLRRVLHLSDALIDELTRWGGAMEAREGTPVSASTKWQQADEDLRRRGQDLAESVQREVGSRYTVTYKPW